MMIQEKQKKQKTLYKNTIMTLFIIAVALAVSCIFGILIIKGFSKYKLTETWIGMVCGILLIIDIFFGLIVTPLVKEIKTDYVEIKNPIVVTSTDGVVVITTNSRNVQLRISDVKIFDSYKAVTEYSDSTKFFIERHKAFYNTVPSTCVVWSNPPYKEFYAK